MEANHGGHTNAVIEVEFWIDFPGILHEFFIHWPPPNRKCARTNFGIAVGIAQRQVSYADTRSGARARIRKREVAVLIVGTARHGGNIDLISVVFASILIKHTELQRVVAPDLRQTVGNRKNRPGGVRGVRAASQTVEAVVKVDGGNLVNDIFSGEKIGIGNR